MTMDLDIMDGTDLLWEADFGVPEKEPFSGALNCHDPKSHDISIYSPISLAKDKLLWKADSLVAAVEKSPENIDDFLTEFLASIDVPQMNSSATTAAVDLNFDMEAIVFSPDALNAFSASNAQVSLDNSFLTPFGTSQQSCSSNSEGISWIQNGDPNPISAFSDYDIVSSPEAMDTIARAIPDWFDQLSSNSPAVFMNEATLQPPPSVSSYEQSPPNSKASSRATSRSKSRRSSPVPSESVYSSHGFEGSYRPGRRTSMKINDRKRGQNVKASRRYRDKKQNEMHNAMTDHEHLLQKVAELKSQKRDLEMKLTFAVDILESRYKKRGLL